MKKVKNYYVTILIMHLFLLMGIILFLSTGIFYIKNFNDFYNYIYKNLMTFVFGIFAFIVYFVILVSLIKEKVKDEKTEVLYFDRIIDNVCYFIDKNGKVYHFFQEEYQVANFYNVVTRNNRIIKILDQTSEEFKLKSLKENYWLNLYSPIGNFHDIFLLPIIYLSLVISILSIILSENVAVIHGIIYGIVPLALILYDLIFKINIRRRKENLNIDFMIFYNKVVRFFKFVIKVTAAIFAIYIVYYLFSISANDETKKTMFVFLIFVILGMLAFLFSKGFKNIKIDFMKIYVSFFGIVWVLAIGKFIFDNKDLISTIIGIVFIVPMLFVLYFKVIRK